MLYCCCLSCNIFQMSDVSVTLDALKISDDKDYEPPEYEESVISPDDSASKVGKTDDTTSVITVTSITSSTTKGQKDELYKRAMKKIIVLEAKIEELTEKLAAYGGSPLKRKKKNVEFNMTIWTTRITDTGYFKSNNGKSVFNSNAARLAYITSLMDFYNTELSSSTTFDDLFEKVNGKYPAFQSLLDAVPVPRDFVGCSLLLDGEKKVTSKYVKVAPEMSMAKM